MLNIIDQIIQIDSIAQKRLDEANRLKEQLAREAEIQKGRQNEEIEQKMKAQLDAIRAEEQQKVDAQKEKIQKEEAASLQRLEQFYAEKHESLETELFRGVIGS